MSSSPPSSSPSSPTPLPSSKRYPPHHHRPSPGLSTGGDSASTSPSPTSTATTTTQRGSSIFTRRRNCDKSIPTWTSTHTTTTSTNTTAATTSTAPSTDTSSNIITTDATGGVIERFSTCTSSRPEWRTSTPNFDLHQHHHALLRTPSTPTPITPIPTPSPSQNPFPHPSPNIATPPLHHKLSIKNLQAAKDLLSDPTFLRSVPTLRAQQPPSSPAPPSTSSTTNVTPANTITTPLLPPGRTHPSPIHGAQNVPPKNSGGPPDIVLRKAPSFHARRRNRPSFSIVTPIDTAAARERARGGRDARSPPAVAELLQRHQRGSEITSEGPRESHIGLLPKYLAVTEHMSDERLLRRATSFHALQHFSTSSSSSTTSSTAPMRHQRVMPSWHDISEIVDGFLYLGPDPQDTDWEKFRMLGITHILNTADECEVPALATGSEAVSGYRKLSVKDAPDERLEDHLGQWLDFLDSARKSGGKVYVHCRVGQSRSPTVVMAYLMCRHHLTFDEAYAHLITRRACVSPNVGFLVFLRELDQAKRRKRFSLPPQPAPKCESTSTVANAVFRKF